MTVLWDGHQTRSENIRGVYLVTLGVKWDWALIRFAGAVSSCPLELQLIRPALQVTANPHQRIFFLPMSRTLLSDPVCNTGTEVTPLWLRTQKFQYLNFSIKPQLAARVLVWNRHSASGGGCRDVPDSPRVSPGVMAALCWRHLCVNFCSTGRLHKTHLLIPAVPAAFYKLCC